MHEETKKQSLRWVKRWKNYRELVEMMSFEPGVKERRSDGW